MIDRGFIPIFPKSVLNELFRIDGPAKPRAAPSFQDLRDRPWISIDNDDSRDLDQLTYAEGNKLYVAIADVDAVVKKGSEIDIQANCNTTSVYTPNKVFPMLPLELSNDWTSLNENTDRCAIVVELAIGNDGRFELSNLYPAYVRNHGKLTYNGVAAFLEKNICPPSLSPFRKQLQLQDEMARRIQSFRDQKGALQFMEIELQVIFENEIAVRIEEKRMNRAHKLIENAMIAANVGATRYLDQRKKPTLRRIVRTPKRWERIVALAKDLGEKLPGQPDAKALRIFLLKRQKAAPLQFPELSLAIIKLIGRGEYVLGLPGQKDLGHFDLAELKYAHTTAPNRRYPDLVMQRLLKSCLYGDPSAYTKEQLASIAAHCTLKEDDATKVERRLMKCAAAMVMGKEIGRSYQAIVTGASERGTWVRLLAPPVEGKLIHGFEDLDVGDHLNVRLVHVDVLNGHIDFQKIP